MRAREVMAEMRVLLRKRERLLRDLERLDDATSPGNGIGDGMPRGSATEPRVERAAIGAVDIQAEIVAIDHDLDTCRRWVEQDIAKVAETSDRRVLQMRYIAWLPVKEISRRLHYEREYLYEKLREAEKKLAD